MQISSVNIHEVLLDDFLIVSCEIIFRICKYILFVKKRENCPRYTLLCVVVLIPKITTMKMLKTNYIRNKKGNMQSFLCCLRMCKVKCAKLVVHLVVKMPHENDTVPKKCLSDVNFHGQTLMNLF